MSEIDSDGCEPVERRLRAERPELTAIELDRIKRSAMAGTERRGGTRMRLKPRLVTGLIVVGLVGTSGGAVLAASGGSSSNGSSANSQYCPPSSPGAGKPKHQGGGNKCGKDDDGGPGESNDDDGGPGESNDDHGGPGESKGGHGGPGESK